MATNINLVTYSGSMVSPLDDAIVYETAIAESGIIYGGNLTIKNVNTIHINAGHGIVCGRKFTITDYDISVQLTSGAQELGRIYLHLDLANTTEPIQILTEIGATLTPVIQQTDVNINNGIYEINLATFNIDSMTIADLVEVFPTVSNPIGYLSDLDTTNKNSIVDAINEVNSKEVSVLDTGEEIMANTTPGKAAGANGVKELITEVNDSLNVKYNSETDMLQIYYDGKWNDWKSADLQSIDISKLLTWNSAVTVNSAKYLTTSKVVKLDFSWGAVANVSTLISNIPEEYMPDTTLNDLVSQDSSGTVRFNNTDEHVTEQNATTTSCNPMTPAFKNNTLVIYYSANTSSGGTMKVWWYV